MNTNAMSPLRVVERKLIEKHGRVGPTHDPYAYVERTVRINGVDITLRECGLRGTALVISGASVWREDLFRSHAGEVDMIRSRWEQLTGVSLERWGRYYDRLHPYFDDPMGRGGEA